MDLFRGAVLVADGRWSEDFSPANWLTVVDEVNFWRPINQDRFSVVDEGGPVFFRPGAPRRAIAGFWCPHGRSSGRAGGAGVARGEVFR